MRPHRRRQMSAILASLAIHSLLALGLSVIVVIQRDQPNATLSAELITVATRDAKKHVIRRRPVPQPVHDVSIQRADARVATWRIPDVPTSPYRAETVVSTSTDRPTELVQAITALPPQKLIVPIREATSRRSLKVSAAPPGSAGLIDPTIVNPAQSLPGLTSFLLERAASDGGPSPLPAYWRAIQERIRKYQRYPRFAREMGIAGTAVVRFVLHRDGHVSNVRVVEGSGSKVLDDAAARSVEDASPFPPFPAAQQGNVLSIQVPIIFQLED